MKNELLHKANIKTKSLPSSACVDLSKDERYHSLSYYLNGGIDLTGEALDNSADVEYDNDEQLNEMDVEGAMSVPYGDPRMSKFRLVENLGKSLAEKASAKSAKGLAPVSTEDASSAE